MILAKKSGFLYLKTGKASFIVPAGGSFDRLSTRAGIQEAKTSQKVVIC